VTTIRLFLACVLLLFAASANPAAAASPAHHSSIVSTLLTPSVNGTKAVAKQDEKTADVVRIALILTLMAILPALVISMTSFVRIVVVLSMIRHALGMPETPPNQMLVALALFLTAIAMGPTCDVLNRQALTPFLNGELTVQEAMDRGTGPVRAFMLRQVRDQDIKAIYDISHKPLPDRALDVGLMQLVPAFMLNELRVAFRIGFVVMLPFLLIDVVVSSILVSLGMLMVPPSTLSLPIKVLMFVLIDGWSLILQGVIGSFR
jgi:flagellar biosynthetic protein FliP